LEYTIDLTEEGIARQKSKHQDLHGQQNNGETNPPPVAKKDQSFDGEFLFLIGFFFAALIGICLLSIFQKMCPTR